MVSALDWDHFSCDADYTERHNPQQQDDFRAQAHELLQDVLTKNNEADERKVSWRAVVKDKADHAQISVIVEFVAGKVTDMLMKMIALYRPDCRPSHRVWILG